MRRRAKSPDGISNIVTKVIKRIEKQSPGRKEEILKAWQGAAGKKASGHSRPVSLRRKILIIEIDSSTWFYELSLKKKTLLKDIRKELGEEKIENIRFRMGEIT